MNAMKALKQSSAVPEGSPLLPVILAMVFCGAALTLAVIGLDALNDYMARGFVSLRGPGS